MYHWEKEFSFSCSFLEFIGSLFSLRHFCLFVVFEFLVVFSTVDWKLLISFHDVQLNNVSPVSFPKILRPSHAGSVFFWFSQAPKGLCFLPGIEALCWCLPPFSTLHLQVMLVILRSGCSGRLWEFGNLEL